MAALPLHRPRGVTGLDPRATPRQHATDAHAVAATQMDQVLIYTRKRVFAQRVPLGNIAPVRDVPDGAHVVGPHVLVVEVVGVAPPGINAEEGDEPVVASRGSWLAHVASCKASVALL